MHKIPLSFCIFSALFLLLFPKPSIAEDKVLLNSPFTPSLQGWKESGKADFSFENHEGLPAARITVGEKTPLEYQQFQYDFSQDIRTGDSFQGEVDVRSSGLHDGAGVYIVLEFLDSSGQRAGIENGVPSLITGAKSWERLTIIGTAPEHTQIVRFALILQAHGAVWFANPKLTRLQRPKPWPKLGNSVRYIKVFPSRIVQSRFLGAGFDTFQHNYPATEEEMNQVLFKRWRELAPSFARMDLQTGWGHKELDNMARHILRMKQSGSVIYVTLWDPPIETNPQGMAAFAEHTADQLEYLIDTKGCTNIRYFCFTNELSLGKWGALVHDMPLYAQYQQALYDAFHKRGLKVGQLATDASPISYWSTIQWAVRHIDNTTSVYGGHHYFSEYAPDSSRFYPWFLQRLNWITSITNKTGKGFILGEFGCRQDGRTINGTLHDDCRYWNTPEEPYTGLQLAEAVIASLNAGVKALAYWTFTDFPFTPGQTYQNLWGVFQWRNGSYVPRDPYYAYGLMTRWFRGVSSVCAVKTEDPLLRVAAVKHKNGWSFAVVNRNHTPVSVHIQMNGLPLTAKFRRYLYNPGHLIQNRFGDLQPPSAVVSMRHGILIDAIGANCLVVYTSDYQSTPPASPEELAVGKVKGKAYLTWKEGPALYYRIYRGVSSAAATEEIGVTIVNHFTDTAPSPSELCYQVRTVDRWDNISRAAIVSLNRDNNH